MTNTNAGFAIDMTNPDTRRKVVLITIISGLALEIECPGLKVSRGVQPLAALKRDFDFKGRTKREGLQFAIDTMKSLDPDYKISTAALKAIS